MKQKKPPKPKSANNPLPNEEDLDAARRKKLAEITSRQGRQSTILSDAGFPGGETLG
jgi:hypothetical protein